MTASGVRVGTPSVTTQGMQEPQMREIAALIAAAVRGEDVGDRVGALVSAFPAYPSSA
jgi:glycine hydroxymethyltransferase